LISKGADPRITDANGRTGKECAENLFKAMMGYCPLRKAAITVSQIFSTLLASATIGICTKWYLGRKRHNMLVVELEQPIFDQ
jgi:hypothetical protein